MCLTEHKSTCISCNTFQNSSSSIQKDNITKTHEVFSKPSLACHNREAYSQNIPTREKWRGRESKE